MPIINPVKKKENVVKLPTAARELSPNPFPIITMSANEYTCCNILENNIGKKKIKNDFVTEPLVKSILFMITPSSN